MRDTIQNRLNAAMSMRGVRAVDVSNATGISKPSISLYMSGQAVPRQNRIYALSKYLSVSEAWLMGYDVTMEREEYQRENDRLAEVITQLKCDLSFRETVLKLYSLDNEKQQAVKTMIDLL